MPVGAASSTSSVDSSWWQHGARMMALAPSCTPAASASSVAVSHACSDTSRSISVPVFAAVQSAIDVAAKVAS